MNTTKKTFSIRDLENLSGIKAHTIRIWEKRYNLLSPERTDTNIRRYSLESLQKLLNITLLYSNGHKISKIANLKEGKIPEIVNELISKNNNSQVINTFKLAMINFDEQLFTRTFKTLLLDKSFSEVFKEVFIPLLNELGLLWQTDTICPAHEHFISNLVKQKILISTQDLSVEEASNKKTTFIAYLPENEIHEIGLLYLNYEIVSRGYKSVYLGQTVPLESLEEVMKTFENATFLSYFTVSPSKDKVDDYITKFRSLSANFTNTKLWLLGHQTQHIDQEKLPQTIEIFSSIDKIVERL
ncbi:MerR family transcriptional regulator [Zobellia barbeyronii]|uniref:MerR family transcriptional regulator n=1 Tax=Zobellia barbeyronii TaxID=2748009 RepID=A0ABS5WJA0_9FLAO|nr:MerR family transcriptional regulator [Zobellia barbeyronii]MBT2163388.1 MerR family transcriptional regulator [Zobellia barbeyronii]